MRSVIRFWDNLHSLYSNDQVRLNCAIVWRDNCFSFVASSPIWWPQLWAKTRNQTYPVSLYLGNDISAVNHIGLEIANGVNRPRCTSVTLLKNWEFRAYSNMLLTFLRFAEKRVAQVWAVRDVVGENGLERQKIKKTGPDWAGFPLKTPRSNTHLIVVVVAIIVIILIVFIQIIVIITVLARVTRIFKLIQNFIGDLSIGCVVDTNHPVFIGHRPA